MVKKNKLLTDSSYNTMRDIQRSIYQNCKTRAKRKGIPFNINIEDIVLPVRCPILKKRLKPNTKYAFSVDKIVPELGYVKGNVAVISTLANNMKANATYDEMKIFVKNILKYYRKYDIQAS